MDVMLCPVQDIHVYRLTDPVIVERTIAIRNDIARRIHGSLRLSCYPWRKFRFLIIEIPHLQEHQGKAPYGISFQHHGRILPMSEALPAVDVLIRKIHASVECHFAVYHQDLAMVTVIIMGR